MATDRDKRDHFGNKIAGLKLVVLAIERHGENLTLPDRMDWWNLVREFTSRLPGLESQA